MECGDGLKIIKLAETPTATATATRLSTASHSRRGGAKWTNNQASNVLPQLGSRASVRSKGGVIGNEILLQREPSVKLQPAPQIDQPARLIKTSHMNRRAKMRQGEVDESNHMVTHRMSTLSPTALPTPDTRSLLKS